MPDTPKDLKNAKALLAEAIRKRDELNTFIKVLQEMIGGESLRVSVSDSVPPSDSAEAATSVADPLSVVYPGMFFGKTQPQAVKMLLERVRPRPLKTKVILECLEKGGLKVGGKHPGPNIWKVLFRSPDTFILVPKAGWGLIDSYEPSVIAKYRREASDEKTENNDENG